MPAGPGANPLWSHETLRLAIGRKGREFRLGPLSVRLQWGRTDYVFRTFSLLDLWTIWPDLMPAHQAVVSGAQPIVFADCVMKVLRTIQPALHAALERDAPTRDAFGPMIITALVEFYMRHDWTRIAQLMEAGEAESSNESRDYPKRTAHQLFVLSCAAAARSCNMSVQEFVNQRIEFCADQIIALDHESEMARAESDGTRAHSWREATMGLAGTFKVKPVAAPPEKQPEWMRALNTHKVVN